MNGQAYDFDKAARQRKLRSDMTRWAVIGGIVLAVLIVFSQCFFVVGEAEQAFVSRFGVIKRVILNGDNTFHQDYADVLAGEITMSDDVRLLTGSGLHFKVPFLDTVQKYPSRLYTYVSDSEVVNTAEKKQYYVKTYAQWCIADPALFSLKLGSMTSAENQLDNLIHPVIVQAINRLTGDDFVSNKDALNAALAQGLKTINEDMAPRGIEVKDIQVHRTILPTANIESTYARMQADRAKVAQQLRSEGQEEYLKAVATTDLEARRIEADAVSEAGLIRGEGDAAALEIYASAYSVDEEFYAYWRSLQALESALDENSVDPGLCHYEKMVSGRYQGELVWRALRQGAADGLFSDKLNAFLTGLEGLTMVQADAFTARPYGDSLLAAACDSEDDREAVYTIIDRIVERSARLVCANLAGILLQTGAGQRIHRPACVVAEGSTFYKGHLFRGKLERLCGSYITGTLGRHMVFRQIEDANLVGTAAAALLNP